MLSACALVLDTHVLVWYAKGSTHQLGPRTLKALKASSAKIVIPAYALIEIQRGFNHKMDTKRDGMRLPPTPLLRLLCNCPNVRILPRGKASLAWEFRLSHETGKAISQQDIPIAAAAMVCRDYYQGPIALVTQDGLLCKWSKTAGIQTIYG